jgi:hypothetical protein
MVLLKVIYKHSLKYRRLFLGSLRKGIYKLGILEKLRQEDCDFEASLDYMVRLCLKKKF